VHEAAWTWVMVCVVVFETAGSGVGAWAGAGAAGAGVVAVVIVDAGAGGIGVGITGTVGIGGVGAAVVAVGTGAAGGVGTTRAGDIGAGGGVGGLGGVGTTSAGAAGTFGTAGVGGVGTVATAMAGIPAADASPSLLGNGSPSARAPLAPSRMTVKLTESHLAIWTMGICFVGRVPPARSAGPAGGSAWLGEVRPALSPAGAPHGPQPLWLWPPFCVVPALLPAPLNAPFSAVWLALLAPPRMLPPAVFTGAFALTAFCRAFADDAASCAVNDPCWLNCAWPDPPQPMKQDEPADWLWLLP
jgi:hypothetical protein